MNKLGLIFQFFLIVVPTLGWAQTIVRAVDAETNFSVPFQVAIQGANPLHNDSLIRTSINGEIHYSIKTSKQVILFSKGYLPQYLTLLPNEVYSVKLAKSFYNLGEVLVTDIHSNRSFTNTVLHVSKISAQQMESMGAVDLKDALSFQNNIRLSRDNAIGSSGLSLMGMSGDNVKLLIDGVPVIGRLFNQLDLEQFNLENMKQIEIVRGPMSVIYGSNALAGSINLITNNTNTKSRFNINGNYESDGQYNTGITVSNSYNNHFVTLSGGRMMFTGLSQTNTDRTFDWIPKEQYTGRLQYSYQHEDAKINVRTEALRSKLIDRGVPLLPYQETAIDQHYTNIRMDNSLSYENKLGESSIQLIAGNNNFRRVKNKYLKNLINLKEQLVPGTSEQDTQSFNASVFRLIFGPNRKRTKGIETLIGLDGNYEIGSGNRIKETTQQQYDIALFGSAEKQLTSFLLVRAGVRFAQNSAFNAPLLYSLQTKLNLPHDQQIKLAYGKGFRAPSLKELYLDFSDSRHEVFGNVNLVSESSYSLTGSYTKYHKWGNISSSSTIDGFYNRVSNKIELIVTGPIQAQYGNIGKYQSIGGGISQSIIINNFKLNFSFNYTGIYNGVDAKKSDFYFSPQYTINPTYMISKINTRLGLYLNHFGAVSRVFSDSENSNLNIQEQDAYTMIDFTLHRQWPNTRMKTTLGVRNLLGVVNINANNTEVGAHTPSTSFISISPGRTYFFTIRYALFH